MNNYLGDKVVNSFLEIDLRQSVTLSIAIYLISNMIRGGVILSTGITFWGPLIPSLLLLYILFTRKVTFEKNYIIWIVSFLSFSLLSVIWTIDTKVTLYVFKNILPILSVSMLIMIYYRNEKDVYNLLNLFYACSIILCLYVILLTDTSSFAGRGEGLFDGWNLNSIAVDLCLGLFSGFIWNRRCGNAKTWFILMVVSLLAIYVLMLSGSRRALLIFSLLSLLSFWFLFKTPFLYRIAIIVVVLSCVLILVFSGVFYETMGARIEEAANILGGDKSGDNSRVFLLFWGIDWFLEKPLLGHGINCFRVLSNQTPMFAGKNFYAHNNYIELLVGVGIIGLIIYYSFLIRLLLISYSQKSYLGKVSVVLIITILFSDFFSVAYYLFDTQYFIIMCYLMVFGYKNNYKKVL